MTADDRAEQDIEVIRIVCGLGNPGDEYFGTRHNLGFDIIDRLAERHKMIQAGSYRFFSFRAIDTASGMLYLIKSQTFMNRSGEAVVEALRLWNAKPDELFVISDDFNLALGSIRIRKTGSAGGHKGLASIIDSLGVSDFPRLRAGIGPLPFEGSADRDRITDFVLSPFLPEENEVVDELISRAVEAIGLVINNCFDLAISKYNSANPTPEN
ncbi:MAG: aminoacyl-tRNA hydrolase [FCB group bacterium]|nr:aminoacyl-tRNA hydrolase [FCB group bacterium]